MGHRYAAIAFTDAVRATQEALGSRKAYAGMDDGGGVVAAWEVLRVLQKVGLRPRRTIRVVMWTNEENGLNGANAYRDAHQDEIDNHVLAMETDSGVFKPRGFGFSGTSEAYAVIQEIGQLLERIESGTITRGGGGADIGPLMREMMIR